MQIQVALDRISLEQAIGIARATALHVDWVEMGTSLIKQYGLAGLQALVAAADPTPVLADLKAVDDVRFEFALAFDGGARSATVLGLAPQVSLETAVQVCQERGRELVVDLMGMSQEQIAQKAAMLPASVVLAPHVSKDAQSSQQRPTDLLGPWANGRRLALAGGLTAADLPGLRDWPDLRVIVGSAITTADDPVAAVRELRRAAGKDTDEHAC